MIALFPGQGAQFVGMGKDLFDNFKIAKLAFEEASDAARLNLAKLCFDGPESDLTATENTQPCLLTASVAAFRVAQAEAGFQPSLVAGHSLGEYSALVAAGALSLGTAAAWVRARGAAMQQAVPAGQGTMAAIMGLADEQVDTLCVRATEAAKKNRATDPASEDLTVEAIVQAANFNSPSQVVIAGSRDAVAKAVGLIKEGGDFAGGKAVPLAVSAPFHCRLMAPARDKMADIFSTASPSERPRKLDCPYVPNRTARITQEFSLILELLIEQIDHAVLWKQGVLAMIEAGHLQGIEFGPGKVLQGLCKRIAPAGGKPLVLTGCGDSTGIQALSAVQK